MMNRIILILLLCLFGGNSLLFAQKEDDKRKAEFEKFKAERAAYMTKEMGLTKDEAAAFWPLNDELQKKKFELNNELRQLTNSLSRSKKDEKAISEEDYRKILRAGAKIRIKEAELDQEYLLKFLEVVPAEKIHKYQRAEREFARKVMDRRDRRPERRLSRE